MNGVEVTVSRGGGRGVGGEGGRSPTSLVCCGCLDPAIHLQPQARGARSRPHTHYSRKESHRVKV